MLEEAEDDIQEILGGYRIDLVLIIKNYRGKILYANVGGKKLGLNPSTSFEWQFTEQGGTTLRLYTKKIPELGRILQIGTVVNTKTLASPFLSKNQMFYFLLLIFVSSLVAYVLTTRFFKPMKRLAEDLTLITNQLHTPEFVSSSFEGSIGKFKNSFFFKKDEFATLAMAVQELMKQIKIAFEMNKNHSARLAHEVNTPLSLIKNRLKQIETSGNQVVVAQLNSDIDRLAQFVQRYLKFSETLNTPAQTTDIYAIKLTPFLKQFEQNMSPIANSRLKVCGDTQAVIFANHHDLEHMLQNLITNALKYSPQDRDVLLNFKEDELVIKDFGGGIPESVLKKVGSPFNIGANQPAIKGTGLGLAWVQAITNKYHWKIEYRSTPEGTEVSIKF